MLLFFFIKKENFIRKFIDYNVIRGGLEILLNLEKGGKHKNKALENGCPSLPQQI